MDKKIAILCTSEYFPRLEQLCRRLETHVYATALARDFFRTVERQDFDVHVIALRPKTVTSSEVWRFIHSKEPRPRAILISPDPVLLRYNEAIDIGAFALFIEPFDFAWLEETLMRALTASQPGCNEVRMLLPRYYRRELGVTDSFETREHLRNCAECRFGLARIAEGTRGA